MEFEQVVRRRRMVRSYDADRDVPTEAIEGLIELAGRAPSAGFSQGWHFLILRNPADRARFWTATARPGPPDRWLTGMRSAPVLILPLSSKSAYLRRYAELDKGFVDQDEHRWSMPYWDLDTAMASLLILLGAVDAGLGSCFFGLPVDRVSTVRQEFRIPTEWTPIGAITVGYPAPDRRSPSLRRGRRPLAEIVTYGSFD
jgi:nitroreductase